MITFNDLRLTDKEHTIFVPMVLLPEIADYLEKENIKYKSINWRNIPKEMESKKLAAAKRFKNAGHTSTTCMGAIVSNVDPEHLFQKCLLFFGDTIDPDYKSEMDFYEEKAHETYEKCYKPTLEITE